MMAPWVFLLGLALGLRGISAIQVTPDSACASVCLEATQFTSTNSSASDIVCKNTDFDNTPGGQKLKSCLTCLQLSKANGGDGDNDAHWFLYNMRYTLSSCLYNFTAVAAVNGGECSTSDTCGPLQSAIEDGNFITSKEKEFSYCSANSYAMLASTWTPKCVSCLRNGEDTSYLSNFMLALQGGCRQVPVAGWIIGFNSSVFSQYPIAGTSPGQSYNTSADPDSGDGHHGLSKGGIIGLAVGLSVAVLLTVLLFVLWFRHQNQLDRLQLSGPPLDERYGAPNITAPTDGAYGNPYADPYTIKASPITHTFAESSQNREEKGSNGFFNLWRKPSVESTQSKTDPDSKNFEDTELPHYYINNSNPNATLPIHQAYIPSSELSPPTSGGYLSSINARSPPPAIHRTTLSPYYSNTSEDPSSSTYSSKSFNSNISPSSSSQGNIFSTGSPVAANKGPLNANISSITPQRQLSAAQQRKDWALAQQKARAHNVLTRIKTQGHVGQKTDCSPAGDGDDLW